MESAVAAVNALTARWCAALDGSFVVSGACAWPLLALVASAADGPARDDLERATGRPAGGARAEALALLRVLDDSQAASAALGVWVRAGIPLHQAWADGLPVGILTDRAALDRWCAQRTDGLIDRMPVEIDASVLMVLATALVARTTWRARFHAGNGRLARVTAGLGDVCVLEGGVTRVVVRGGNDLDVQLLMGDDALGIALTQPAVARAGAALAVGDTAPGLVVTEQSRGQPLGDRVLLTVPPFALHSHHDLLEHAELFGLAAATDDRRGHFPHMSPEPLAVDQAAQDVRAEFSETGFEAAAVTAIAMQAGAAPPPPGPPFRQVEVRVEPPFAFVAVHRPSGLAVVAGRVAAS